MTSPPYYYTNPEPANPLDDSVQSFQLGTITVKLYPQLKHYVGVIAAFTPLQPRYSL